MKKVRNLVLFLLLLLSFSRCEKDRVSEEAVTPGSSFTVEQAEAWFGADWQGTVSLKSGHTENTRIGIKPDWCNGFTSQNNEVEVVEVGLLTQGRFDMADEASYNEWVKTKNPKMIRSLTRMVFLKFKKDGRIDQFLMTIVGDKEYHENQVSRLSDNAYLSREKHFSGHIYYHDLTGKFVNGWVYEKGKLEGITFLKEGQSLPTELKMATTCITTTQYTTYVECTDWYRDYDFDGEAETYTNTTCGSTFVATSTFTECPVYFTGLDGTGTSYLSATGSGGTNGGYNPTLQPPCNCANICDVCGKCKDELLKSGSVNCIPWDDCSCLPPNPYSDPNRPCLGDPIKYATICPTSSGRVTGGLYGCRRVGDTDCNEGIYDKFPGGVDISAPIGSDIYTMHPGKVKYVGYESGGLGNYIIIASEIGGQTLDITYGHLSNTNVGVNNRVFENTIIGQSGDSGNAGG